MHNAKRTREEQAREDAIQERRKEIEADRLHREKIKRQLEDDKRERAARRGLVAPVADVGNNASVTPISPLSQRQGESSTSCRLQLRFPDGATFVHIFHSQDDTLHNVRQYIQQEARSMESQKFYKWVADGSFSLARTFPRQDFHGEDEARSLGDLGLSPSSALMVLPLSGSNVSSGGSGTIIASGGTLLNNVFLTVWRIACYLFSFLTSILPFNTSSTSNTASASPRAGQNSAPGPSQDKGPKSSTDSQTQNSETRFRGEKRLHDLRRDDDDEATWNGNSTQQM
jgi:UBX domain-containing protein 1/4